MADPLGIGSCNAWYDASDLSTIAHTGGLVDSWTDKSGNARTQTATTTRRPTTGTRYLNGRNVLDFNGTANWTQNTAIGTQAAPFTLGVVFQSDVAGDSAYHVFLQDVTNGSFVGMDTTNKWMHFSGGALLGGTTDTNVHRGVYLHKASPNAALAIDGTIQATGDAGGNNWAGGMNIGGGAGGSYFNGVIAEVVTYSVELSVAQRTLLDQYFYSKWVASPAIVVTTPPRMFHPRAIRATPYKQVSPEISARAVTNGLITTGATSNVTASVTPTSGELQVLLIRTFKNTPSTAPSSVTGCGLTWESVQTSGGFGPSGNNGIYLYRAMGTATTGQITMNWAVAPGDLSWQLTEFSNTDTSGTNGSGAIVQSDGANSGTGAISSAPLAAFGDTVRNATYAAVAQNANQVATTNLQTLIFTSAAAGNGGMSVGWERGAQTAPTFSFVSASWGSLAVEIKAAPLTPSISGTSSTTNAADTSAASGTTTVTGTLARTNANDTSAAAGTTTVTGTLARTNANDTLAASGSAGSVSGTLARTNANDTSVAAGTTTVTGTLARTNANDTSVATGTTTVTGTLARTNANDTLAASGTAAGAPVTPPTEPTGGGYEVSRATRESWRRERQQYEEAQAYAELLDQEDEEIIFLI